MGTEDTRYTPNPIPGPGPDPDPFPGPGPGPDPVPEPIPGRIPGRIPERIPREWWRCRRIGPVSGRYEGEMTQPRAGGYALDLRVDIDPRHPNSPVMDRVSGDLYQVYRFSWGSRVFTWRVYRESWVVENPAVSWSRCSVTVRGSVTYPKGSHPTTTLTMIIPWGTFQAAGPASVTFTEAGGGSNSYSCARKSSAFRTVELEVDVCSSVNNAPLLPDFDTAGHPDRPASLPQRNLTVESAYLEAGIDLTVNPIHTVIDDSAAQFTSWSVAELHDAMEQHFSRISGGWPKWYSWCLVAGRFDNAGVGGIMFDAAANYGGAGKAPERQGCAVFRDHQWFNNLAPNPPANDIEAAAMRKYLYTFVHEIGHGFNFLHSWDKSRPDALSWMNYDWRYDNRNGANSFWSDFWMRFDDEELIHLRHGDRSEVIPGGDAWTTGWHLESPPGASTNVDGNPPVELLVRSKGYYEFMEPVSVELRLRNTTDLPLELDTRLNPELGGVAIYIRRPDGRMIEYAPLLCKLADPAIRLFGSAQQAAEGADRYSEEVFLSFGSSGHYFNEPGEYLLRAVYQGAGNIYIASNIHRLRVGQPFSREEERAAQDVFGYEAGLALYMGGSASPFLTSGMDALRDAADRFANTAVGAQLAMTLAHGLSRPFHRIDKDKLVMVADAEPEAALALTSQALEQHKRDDSTLSNIAYHQCRRTRAQLLAAEGRKADARKELASLSRYLKKRNVKPAVLDSIGKFSKSL